MIRADDGSFYVFGSHLAAARSTDLMNWQYVANGVDATNPLYSTIPLDGTQWTGVPGSWAADVIKLKNGKYLFLLQLLRRPAHRRMQRAALVSRRRGFRSHRRSVRRPGNFPALGHDGRGDRGGIRAPKASRATTRAFIRTPSTRMFSTTRRQAVDDLRLVFRRHFHPANG